MEPRRLQPSGFSPVSEERFYSSRLFVTAAASVFVLGAAACWSLFGGAQATTHLPIVAGALETTEPDDSTSILVDTIGANAGSKVQVEDIGPMVVGTIAAAYTAMQTEGTYTPEAGAQTAADLGKAITAPVQYKRYTITDLQLSENTSYNGMLAYRASLQEALSPLMRNTEPEIGIFALYVDTRDAKYLDQLRAVAADYSSARDAAAALSVPKDAGLIHAGILNAMGQFGAVLKGLADNAQDPITSTALLQTYNEGETSMITSFNNLAKYYAQHSNP